MHHIVPKHMGGSNDPDNLQQLTIEEHAQAHLELHEKHGDERDLLAHRMLLGQITTAEARLARAKLPKNDSHKKKISESMKGEKNPQYGKPTSKKQKESVRIANSVPKPHVSENMKKLHAEGKARQWTKEEARSMVAKRRPRKWYTNGIDNKAICEGEHTPEGYWRGRTTGWKTHL